jgi:hypothetical protein
MDNQTFDALVRRAAVVRDRRSLLGLLTGALLATAGAPRGTVARIGGENNPRNDCKDKDEKQKARNRAHECRGRANGYCLHLVDIGTAAACAVELEACCAFTAACLNRHARQCTLRVQGRYPIFAVH